MFRLLDRLVPFLAFVFCAYFFTLQCGEIYRQYRGGASSTAIGMVSEGDTMKMPVITACPVVSYRDRAEMRFEEQYLNNTWEYDDIFFNVSRASFQASLLRRNVTETIKLDLSHPTSALPRVTIIFKKSF